MRVAVAATALLALLATDASALEMERVPGGSYPRFFAMKDEPPIPVAPFDLDERPVTNAEYLEFVRAHPEWSRSGIPRLFADEAYLAPWAGDFELGPEAPPDRPVTFVSWFAATAYCESLGKRLPREAEWELAEDPPGQTPEAKAEAERLILAFYARPRGPLPRAGQTPPNAYALRDMYGVIWEWISDWGASVMPVDPRSGADSQEFCGGAAAMARSPESYATFMRFAFRSSVEQRFALHHLGFRCAKDAS